MRKQSYMPALERVLQLGHQLPEGKLVFNLESSRICTCRREIFFTTFLQRFVTGAPDLETQKYLMCDSTGQ